nr:hypothetical protein [uncultured Dongia sp.]
MTGATLEYFMHYRPIDGQTVEQRHAFVVEAMSKLPPPLSWEGLRIPPAPDFGEGLTAHFEVAYATPGIELVGDYIFRGRSYIPRDSASSDDRIVIEFDTKNQHLKYRSMLHQHLAGAISAFGGYLARGLYSDYSTQYHDLHRAELDKLLNDSELDLNGRNNIFSLQVVQFWDAELCQRALGYGRDEVIKRLTGKVSLVRPLMDGVYVVFNDDPDLTFEEFCAYNDRLKPVLGLQ